MTQSPAVVSRRGGKGLYKISAVGLRKPGTKSKTKMLTEDLECNRRFFEVNDALINPTEI
ncbi:MAG: hypothetical protein HQ477_00410 [Chloroflexi bacterium]|nr:hypothetical protein [Chloroflexota bacterium]